MIENKEQHNRCTLTKEKQYVCVVHTPAVVKNLNMAVNISFCDTEKNTAEYVFSANLSYGYRSLSQMISCVLYNPLECVQQEGVCHFCSSYDGKFFSVNDLM